MYLVFDKYALLILNWEKNSNLIINNILKFSNEIKQFASSKKNPGDVSILNSLSIMILYHFFSSKTVSFT